MQRQHSDYFRLSLTDTEGAPRPLQAQPHRCRGSTQTISGSASQTQREHPDHGRLSLTDAEEAPRPRQAQPHRHRGSTRTTAGSASQMQREHPDCFRLSLSFHSPRGPQQTSGTEAWVQPQALIWDLWSLASVHKRNSLVARMKIGNKFSTHRGTMNLSHTDPLLSLGSVTLCQPYAF